MSFGENFGYLDRGEHAPFVRAITAMASVLTFNQMCKYWGLMGVRQYFTPKKLLGQRAKNVKTAMQMVQRRIKNGSEHRDSLHYILSANDEKGMSPAEINVNAFSLSIAGSESTATALSGAAFLMLTYPSVYHQLVEEVRSAHSEQEEITLASTQKLTYLDAVITETLRIYPPVTITMPRRVPVGGEIIEGKSVPQGTTVGVNHYSTYHHPANFHQPNEFLPERWLLETRDAAPFINDNKECMQPFSYGPRNCLGRNIARAEMRLLSLRGGIRLSMTQRRYCVCDPSSRIRYLSSQRSVCEFEPKFVLQTLSQRSPWDFGGRGVPDRKSLGVVVCAFIDDSIHIDAVLFD
jgi:cytochrome P450